MSNGDLVLAYHFDEAAAEDTVYDSGGHGLDCELAAFIAENGSRVEAPVRGPGRMVGGGLSFGGRSLLEVGTHVELDLDRFTLMAWVYFREEHPDPAETRLEVMERVGAYWMNIRLDTRRVRIGFRTEDGQRRRWDSSGAIPTSPHSGPPVWTHLAATYDGDRVRIFIDGVEDVDATDLNPEVTGDPCASDHPLTIGGRYTPYPWLGNASVGPDALFNGGIDEVRIFSRALSSSEISAYLGDVYMRDNLSDDGSEPLGEGPISRSPDINHYANELTDPATILASPAAAGRDDLFEDIEIGQPNYIYLRLHNRGLAASHVEVDLYWSPPSTFLAPASWNRLGTIPATTVEPGVLTIAGPLVWEEEIPERGHYCFIAVAGSDQDPKPDLDSIDDIDAFHRLIRNRNNVTWKNFTVDNQVLGSQKRMDFQIQGWPRKSFRGDLEIDLTDLPAICQTELRLLRRLMRGAECEGLIQLQTTSHYAHLGAKGGRRARLRHMPLGPGERAKATLTIDLPENLPHGAYEVSVSQRIQGREMGRLTSRLLVGDYPFVGNRSSGEFHRANCHWALKMASRNKVALRTEEQGLQRGFDGCSYCLPRLHTH